MSDAEKSVHELNADLFEPEEAGRFHDPKEARKKAMDYLARREYGRRELIDKLCTAGFDGEIAGEAVERLRSEGLQDDRRFVEGFAQSRINQGKGPLRVQTELRQRGIDAAVVDDVLADLDPVWAGIAREVRRKKFGERKPGNFPEKARQMRFLKYRGFSQSQIESAVGDNGDEEL